jgi:hypothetical protein
LLRRLREVHDLHRVAPVDRDLIDPCRTLDAGVSGPHVQQVRSFRVDQKFPRLRRGDAGRV